MADLRFILPMSEILESTGQQRLAKALPELLVRKVATGANA